MPPVRILALADLRDDAVGPGLIASARPNLVVSCGDLPADYLEYVVTIANVPLVWVPGNHDPDARPRPQPVPALLPMQVQIQAPPFRFQEGPPGGPGGCTAADGTVVRVGGLLVGGLGGSVRYSDGPNQYTQRQMRRRALRFEARHRLLHPGRGIDLLLTHAPPLGVGDDDDPAHRGFAAFHRLVAKLSPRILVHGHVHPGGRVRPDRWMGQTRVVNAVPHRLIELDR